MNQLDNLINVQNMEKAIHHVDNDNNMDLEAEREAFQRQQGKKNKKNKNNVVAQNLYSQTVNTGGNSEFDLINRNEATDVNLKGNLRMIERKAALIPFHGPGATVYRTIYLTHKLIVMFYYPFIAAFMVKPTPGLVVFDFYLDFVFLTEIITLFFMPFNDANQRVQT